MDLVKSPWWRRRERRRVCFISWNHLSWSGNDKRSKRWRPSQTLNGRTWYWWYKRNVGHFIDPDNRWWGSKAIRYSKSITVTDHCCSILPKLNYHIFLEPGSLSSVAEFHLFRIMQFVTHHVHHGLFAFTENTDGDDLYRCHTLKCMIPDAG